MRKLKVFVGSTRNTLALISVSLAVLTLLTIGISGVLGQTACVTEPCESYPQDANDYQTMPTETMWTQYTNGQTCGFKDQTNGLINTVTSSGWTEQGEWRLMTNLLSGNSSTLATSTQTSDFCPFKTKRTRWGMFTYDRVFRQLTWFYDVTGRNASCNFLGTTHLVRSSCLERQQIAWNGCDACPEAFAATQGCNCVYMTPILLSLIPGQRFDISSPEGGVQFDWNSDGKKSLSSWPVDTKNLGFLYLDTSSDRIDADGVIIAAPSETSGMNLFGNMKGYTNGFKQLASWDDQQWVPATSTEPARITGPPDGVISKKDGIWNRLRVWFDYPNRNGTVDAGELKRLDELNIETLELTYKESERKDGNGNRIPFVARFFKSGDQQPYFMTDFIAAVKKN